MTGKYVPIEDVAKHFSVSISTIRAWVRQQDIPQDTYIKVGKRDFYLKRETWDNLKTFCIILLTSTTAFAIV